jgi:hypothetical protein
MESNPSSSYRVRSARVVVPAAPEIPPDQQTAGSNVVLAIPAQHLLSDRDGAVVRLGRADRLVRERQLRHRAQGRPRLELEPHVAYVFGEELRAELLDEVLDAHLDGLREEQHALVRLTNEVVDEHRLRVDTPAMQDAGRRAEREHELLVPFGPSRAQTSSAGPGATPQGLRDSQRHQWSSLMPCGEGYHGCTNA